MEEKKSCIRRINDICQEYNGISNLLSSVISLITIISLIITFVLYILSLVQIAKVEDKLAKEKENINTIIKEQQVADFQTYTQIVGPQPFSSLGPQTSLKRNEMLYIKEVLEYPHDCKYYWLFFQDSDNRVWPKLSIKNTGHQYQPFEAQLSLPNKFEGGKLIFACVSNEMHSTFQDWLDKGHETSLIISPSEFDVIFKSILKLISS